jgi:hypothetical protein
MSVSSIDVKNSELGMSTLELVQEACYMGMTGVHQELLVASSVQWPYSLSSLLIDYTV